MSNSFYSSLNGQLKFSSGLPGGFEGPFLPEGISFYHQSDMGTIVVQMLQIEHSTLQLEFVNLSRKTILFPTPFVGLKTVFLFKGQASFKHNKKSAKCSEGRYLFVNGGVRDWGIEINMARASIILSCVFPDEVTNSLQSAFPLIFGRLGNHQLHGPYNSRSELREVVHQLLHASFEPYLLPLYYKAKMAEYLLLLLHDASGTPDEKQITPTKWELESLYKLRDFVVSDLQRHYSILELAKKFKMSESRLKILFKQEFGAGPYTFLLNARLDKIKELMNSGMPMKEAAPLAGYQTTSFITAFKKRFGYPPGTIFRRKE